MPDTATTDLTALALLRLHELRDTMVKRHSHEIGLLNEAIVKLEVVQRTPPPPRRSTKWINVYANGLGSKVYDVKSVAVHEAMKIGYHTFGEYIDTIQITAELPPR